MLSRRIRCHACGERSRYSSSSGIEHFQCHACQAWNFLDQNGDYIDPPQAHIERSRASSPSFTIQSSQTLQQKPQVFCSTCVQNQQIYSEALANYLPDEKHPQYAKYENELPQYKAKLEARYPQICKRCAPIAQKAIHDADYQSLSSNAERLMHTGRTSRRSMSPQHAQGRDNNSKLLMRILLNMAGVLCWLSILYEVLWHAYSILMLRMAAAVPEDAMRDGMLSRPKASQCFEQASRSIFSLSCCNEIATNMPKALLVSALLLWYNAGLKKLYDPYTRYTIISGQKQHLMVSAMTLAMRTTAYKVLSQQNLALTAAQAVAAHAFTLIFTLISYAVASSIIRPQKWKIEGNMMPRPEDQDILGQMAGPARETHTPYASPTAPSILLRDHQSPSFPIGSLANQSTRYPNTRLPPSPPGSDHGDPMDIEPDPLTMTTPSRTGQGWEGMRTNILSLDDELRAKQERQRSTAPQPWLRSGATFSPFRGQLPPAPSSQEKRLRNPTSQVPRFKETSVSQQQNFLNQMREGIARGRGFGASRAMSVETEASDITTDARSRTRGQLDLDHSSAWHLPGDGANATGLEDMFSGSFQIAEPSAGDAISQPSAQTQVQDLSLPIVASLLGACAMSLLLGIALDIGSVRRPVCLFLVQALELIGY